MSYCSVCEEKMAVASHKHKSKENQFVIMPTQIGNASIGDVDVPKENKLHRSTEIA